MWVRLGLIAMLVTLACRPAAASSFSVDTSAFLNNGPMPKSDAAGGECGGRNLSPPFRLSGEPAAARSFAIVAFDTDAGHGAGFVHWVAYGIAPTVSALPPGFGSQPSAAYTGGANDAGTTLYFGPCPPKGDPAHHYVFTVYALDVAPGALAPGLTRAQFLHAIETHRLAQSQITGRYAR